MRVRKRRLDAWACPRRPTTWAFADPFEEDEPKVETNPHISTIAVRDGAIRPKNNLLSAAARPVPENFLLDVRRLFWEATEDERIGIFRTSLNWAYKEMLVNEPAMSGRVAAKPAHIRQIFRRRRGVVSSDGPRCIANRDAIEEPLVKYLFALSLYCGKV